MSKSRFGINVEEDRGGGSKAIAHLEHRFNADTGMKDDTAPSSSWPTSACKARMAA